jgi:hypothetical protein
MGAVTSAADKLRRINQLWEKLRATKTDTPEYKRLINEIGVLSMEYHQVVELTGQPTQIGPASRRSIP